MSVFAAPRAELSGWTSKKNDARAEIEAQTLALRTSHVLLFVSTSKSKTPHASF
jgi:hypothetical protein